jgi:hypothetical protein
MKTFVSACLQVEVMQAVTSDDKIACNQFAMTVVEKLDEDNKFLRSSLMRLHSAFQGR